MIKNKIIFAKTLIGTLVVFGIFSAFSFVGIKTVLAAPNCTIPSAYNRTIINFPSTASVLSDREIERSRVTVNANLPAGTYRVTLYGYDEYASRGSVSQPNERYYVRLSNGVNSNSLSDLPDRVVLAQRTQVVNNSLNVPTAVTSITAMHSVYPDNSSPNSISPGCVAFDLISAPIVVPVAQPLTGSCSVNPTNVNNGGYLNWSASASGGNGTYTYSWTGTDSLYGSSSFISKAYFIAGTKTGTVTITSGSQSVTRTCTGSVGENTINGNLSVSCTGGPSNVDIDEDVTWHGYASGGNGTYTYSWTGTDGLVGNSQTITSSYDDNGTKRATVTVTSGSLSATASCNVSIQEEEQDDLSVSCYANPSNPQVGSQVNWYANVSGGNGDYDYDWTGTDGLDTSSRSPSMVYRTAGNKIANVVVRSSDGQRVSRSCNVNVFQNTVLAYSQSNQMPMAAAVYLSQLPYTGLADNFRLSFFVGMLALFSAWMSYVITSHQKNREVN